MRTLVALLGLLLLMPFAAAQLPADVCGPIEATALAPRPLAQDEIGTITLTIDNLGEAAVRASGSLSITATGWEYDAESASPITIQPGASGAITFEVRPTAEASGDATASLVARATCLAPTGADCNLPQCALEDATSTRVQTVPAEGLQIPGLQDLDFPPEYLIASLVLVGLVAAIAMLARRPARGVAAECPEPLKLLSPGRGASFPIEVRNSGGEPVTAQLDVGSVPEGWSAFMPLPDVQLAPRETRSMFLMVRAPEEATTGDAVEVEVTVRPQGAGAGKASHVRVRAEVNEAAAHVPPAPQA